MKISTSVVALVAGASFVFGSNISLNVLERRDLNISIGDDVQPKIDIGDTCKTQLITFKDCLENPTNTQLEKDCQVFMNDQCQNLFKDPVSQIPGCKDNLEVMEELQLYIKSFVPLYQLGCAKDEVGQRCPFSETSLKTSFFMINGTEFERLTKETCQSDICRDLTIKAYHKDSAQKLSSFKVNIGGDKKNDKPAQVSFTEYLDSDECKAMSGATTLKISGGLLLTLALYLLSLY